MFERMVQHMSKKKKSTNAYDDGNIPKVDLPQDKFSDKTDYNVEPLPESSRPRKDGPGGESGVV